MAADGSMETGSIFPTYDQLNLAILTLYLATHLYFFIKGYYI